MVDDPEASEDQREISRRDNAIEKVVVSDTLSEDDTDPWRVFFICVDIEKTHGELRERGVEFPILRSSSTSVWWALLEDPDATRYALGQ